MNEILYQMYRQQKRLVSVCVYDMCDASKDFIADIKPNLLVLEEKCPEYKIRYDKEREMHESFTYEQIDFICWQIGEWYMRVKNLFEVQHNLGHEKEILKMMICGDE